MFFKLFYKISNKKMLEQVNKFSWGKAVKETRSVINSVKDKFFDREKGFGILTVWKEKTNAYDR